MKNWLIYLAFVALGVGSVACSSDDTSISAADYPTAIKGTWVESELIYLNEHKHFISSAKPSNLHGCDVDEIEIKDQTFSEIRYYQYDHNVKCEQGMQTHTYELEGNQINTEFIGDDYIQNGVFTIINVSPSQLTLERKATWYDNGTPTDAFYIKTVYHRK